MAQQYNQQYIDDIIRLKEHYENVLERVYVAIHQIGSKGAPIGKRNRVPQNVAAMRQVIDEALLNPEIASSALGTKMRASIGEPWDLPKF